MPGMVQSVERAAAILRVLARTGRPLSLAEVASALDLAKGTAHGLLKTLKLVGFVDQENASGRYLLASEPLEATGPSIDPHELRSRAMNWADGLAARTGLSVRLGVLDQETGDVLLVHHVFRPDGSPQPAETGRRFPAHATALGKVLLAYSAGAVGTAVEGGGRLGSAPRPERLLSYTVRTLSSPAALVAALESVRRAGWALDVEEWSAGQAGLAAPVRAPGGLVVGAIGIRGPVDAVCSSTRAPRPALLEHVLVTAGAVSRELAS